MSTRSKFEFSDQAISRRVGRSIRDGMSRVRGFGFITDLFEGLFYFLISLGAFSIRAIIRRKLGERSFGVFTIIFTFIWIRMFYAHDLLIIRSCEDYPLFGPNCGPFAQVLYIFYIPFLIILSIVLPSMASLKSPIEFKDGFENAFYLFNVEADGSFAGYWSLIFLVSAIFIFGKVIYRSLTKTRWYSYHRGKSIFNGLVGRKIGPFVIKDHHVWMIIEPLFVAIIAFGLSLFTEDIVMVRLLLVGALCLFIEEYSVYKQERSIILDLIDQEIQADYITSVKNRYKEDEEKYRDDSGRRDDSEPQISI